MRRLWLVLVLAGCKPAYDGVRLELEDTAPDGTVVSGEALVLIEGVPLLISAELRSSKSKAYDREDNVLELESEDEAIVTVARTDKAWQFVIIGSLVGETCVRVVVDGDEMECIPAEVIAQ